MTSDQSHKARHHRQWKHICRIEDGWMEYAARKYQRQRKEVSLRDQLVEADRAEADAEYMSQFGCEGYSGCQCWECE